MGTYVTYEQALANKVTVSNGFALKEAVKRGDVMIVSTDQELYSKLVERFNKEKTAKTTKTAGIIVTALGVAATVATAGLFAPITLSVAAAGAISGVTGMVLDDYKEYSLSLDFDKKNVIFLKVKGTPRLKSTDVRKHSKEI